MDPICKLANACMDGNEEKIESMLKSLNIVRT